MKATLRIPTKEQYSYVELEFDKEDLNYVNIKEKYHEYTQLMNGLDTHSEFYQYITKLIDSDLSEWGDVEYYNSLSSEQKGVAQAIKRFYKRLQNKEIDD